MPDQVAALIQWVAERESIRKKKEAGLPAPWSDDPIFQTYRFCNVRRKDDRVSRWLRQNVLTEVHLNKGFSSFIEFTAFCRWCNWPPTIAAIMQEGLYPVEKINWKAVAKCMDRFKKEHKKCWTSAYMVIGPKGSTKSKARFITTQVVGKSIGGAIGRIEQALQTKQRREVWLVLNSLKSHGPFMSGQIVDDLSWTTLLSDATDTFTWAPQGPGSLRGFNRLMELPLKTRHSEQDWCQMLSVWRGQVIEALGPEYEDCTLHDTQNQLCELDKMLRVKNGEGRPRSKYRPETAF
jgi:hypothetical protein